MLVITANLRLQTQIEENMLGVATDNAVIINRLGILAYICFKFNVLKTFLHDSDQGTLWDHSLDVAFSNACLIEEIECCMHKSCDFIWNK